MALLLQVSTQTSKSTLRFTGQGPNFDNANASTVLTVVNGGSALNVTTQVCSLQHEYWIVASSPTTAVSE